jgi:DNA-directed RNA polymerase subunit M/transcription elongation factor TFIIS
MYCKRCSKLYTLDLKIDNTVFLNCKNCKNEEDLPNYIQSSFETIFYINNQILYINKKIEMFFCK